MPTYRELLEQQMMPQAIPEQNRGLGEWLGDTGISALNAALGIPKALGGLGQLIPGVNRLADPFVSGIGQAQEALYAKQSQIAQAARQEMMRAAQEGRYWDAAGSALTNPSNLADLVASGVASLGGMKMLGMGAGALAARPGMLNPYAQKFMGLQPWQKAGALEGLYTAGAVADQFVDPEQFYNPERLAAIPLGALTGLIGGASARYLPGSDIEARLLGGAAPTEIPSAATGSLVNRMLSSPNAYLRAPMQGAREAGEEFLQSYQEALWPQGVMQGEFNYDQAMAEGLLGAIPGGVIGGAYGIRNRPTQLPPPPTPAQGLPGQFAQDSWFEAPQTPAMLGGQAIPSADYAAMANAMYAPYTQGSRPSAGLGISTLGPTPGATTSTSFMDLMAGRQPRTLTPEDYVLRDQQAAEAAQRETEMQQMGIALGGKGYTGARTPAEGLRVIPSTAVPVSGAAQKGIIADLVESGFSPEQAAVIAAQLPAQHLGTAPDQARGAWAQQALPLEITPSAREQELAQVNAARGIASAARPEAVATPGEPGEQLGLLDTLNTLDKTTEGMSPEQAQQFLEDFRKREIANQIAQGKNPIQAAQYANTITGRAQEQYAAKVAALQGQQEAAMGQWDTAEAATNEALAAAIAKQETEQTKAAKALSRRRGLKQIQTAGENRVGFKAPRGTKGAVEPITNALYQREPGLVALSEEEAYAEAAVADLDEKLAKLKEAKPVGRITGEQESLNKRIDAEANRLLQVKKAVDATVNDLARKLENPETKNAITRRTEAKAAAEEQLKDLIKQHGTGKYSDFKTARAIAAKNIAAQDKAIEGAKAAETPYGIEAAPTRDKAVLMQEGKTRSALEKKKGEVMARAAQGETMPTTPVKGSWKAKYEADVAARNQKQAENVAKAKTPAKPAAAVAPAVTPTEQPPAPAAEPTAPKARSESALKKAITTLRGKLDADGKQGLADILASIETEGKDKDAFIAELEAADAFVRAAPGRPLTAKEAGPTLNIAGKKFGIDVEAILKTAAEARKPKVEELTPEGAITSFRTHLADLVSPFISELKDERLVKAYQKIQASMNDLVDKALAKDQDAINKIYKTIKALGGVNPKETVGAKEFLDAFVNKKGG